MSGLNLETADERELWRAVFPRAWADDGTHHACGVADAAVRAYRERLPEPRDPRACSDCGATDCEVAHISNEEIDSLFGVGHAEKSARHRAEQVPTEGASDGPSTCAMTPREVEDGSGKLRITVEVDGAEGDVYLSRDMWAHYGDRAGWETKTRAAYMRACGVIEDMERERGTEGASDWTEAQISEVARQLVHQWGGVLGTGYGDLHARFCVHILDGLLVDSGHWHPPTGEASPEPSPEWLGARRDLGLGLPQGWELRYRDVVGRRVWMAIRPHHGCTADSETPIQAIARAQAIDAAKGDAPAANAGAKAGDLLMGVARSLLTGEWHPIDHVGLWMERHPGASREEAIAGVLATMDLPTPAPQVPDSPGWSVVLWASRIRDALDAPDDGLRARVDAVYAQMYAACTEETVAWCKVLREALDA